MKITTFTLFVTTTLLMLVGCAQKSETATSNSNVQVETSLSHSNAISNNSNAAKTSNNINAAQRSTNVNATQNNDRNTNATIDKMFSKKETKGGTQQAGFIPTSGYGRTWSTNEINDFDAKCNPTNKNDASKRVSLVNYCGCLKAIMQNQGYKPKDINKAVKNHQKEVSTCIKNAVQ